MPADTRGRRKDLPMARLCPPGKFHRALDQLEHDFAAGLEALEGLARTYAKDPDVRAALGMAYLDDQQPFAALPHLEWSERKDPTPALRDALVAAYLALEMPQHALRLAARSQYPSHDRDLEGDARAAADAAPGVDLPVQDRLVFERARAGVLHGERGSAAALERLLQKHPGYQPARNLLVTERLVRGDLEGFVEAANAALAHAPDDPHALLNATRAAFLHGGVDAARALQPRAGALVPDAGWGGDRYLALAGALALMDDAEGTEAALSAYHDWVEATGDDGQADRADAFDDLLERRRRDPRAPLVDLHELIVGVVSRWKESDSKRILESVQASLTHMPGVLRQLPTWIGYQEPSTLRLLAMLLVHDLAPPPPRGSWAEVFERVAMHGPGTREARQALLLLLAETGHIDEDEVVALDGADDDHVSLRLRRLEITGEGVPSGLPAEDEERMIAALEDLQAGRAVPALAALGTLHERHPDSLPLAYNLALAERRSGGEATRRGHERLQRLADEHPDYLLARAELALAAIEAGDLDEAEALLALPEGKRRFHAYEWGVFTSATAHLALARGDVEAAERFLDGIAETLGSDAGPYRALDDAIDRFHREQDPDSVVFDEDDDAFDEDDGFDAGDDVLEDGDVVLEEDDDGLDDGDDVFEEDDETAVALAKAPDLDALAALPTLEEHWCIDVRPAGFMIGEEPEATLTWLAAVANDDGFVRLVTVEPELVGADALYRLFARACVGGTVGAVPGRPRRVSLADADLAEDLAERAASLGIEVVPGDTEPAAVGVRSLAEALGGGVPSWLAEAEDEHVDAFFDAIDTFYDVMPWRRFPSDGYVAFRVGDGPWRYATLMGHAAEEYGLAVFPGWREAGTVVRGAEDGHDAAEVRIEAIGSVESLSLVPVAAISPLDAGRYLEAGLEPDPDGRVAAWLRFEADGPARPEQGPGVYAVLIELLAEHAQRTRHRVRRIDAIASTPAGRLRVLFPATGDETNQVPATPTARREA
jgi:hypothetical protein